MVYFTRLLFQQLREKPDLRNIRPKKNWKAISLLVFGICAALCPIYIYPLYNNKAFSEILNI